MIAVVQLDGTNRELVTRMTAAGEMPALASLLERGEQLELESPGTHLPAAAFHTLYSGIAPGDHGVYYPYQWVPERQRATASGDLEQPRAVWEAVAPAGRRALVIDPYETSAPRESRGSLVSGWQFTERTVLPRWSQPRGVWRALSRVGGRPPYVTEVFGAKEPAAQLRLRDRLIEASGRAALAAESLLGSSGYDLAWIAFSAAHIGGHQLLDLSQLAREPADGEERRQLEDALPAVYRALDRALARVLAALPDDAELMVVSVLGMEVNTSRADLLPGMLEGVLSGDPLPEEAEGGAIWRLRAALPTGLRGTVARALPARIAPELTAWLETRGYDWSRTEAFAHPADNQGYVRLNLRDREAEGIVDPAAAPELLERIRTGLLEFRDPDGEPAIAAIDSTPELFPGRRADRLPDLTVRWSPRPASPFNRVEHPRLGTVHRRGSGSGRSGNHPERDCWALLAPSSARRRSLGRPPRLVDVTATAMALLGVEPPDPAAEPLLEA